MPDKEIFVLKIVWKKSIASLHRLTQAVQRTNLRRTAGDPTWVNKILRHLESMPSLLQTQKWMLCEIYVNTKKILMQVNGEKGSKCQLPSKYVLNWGQNK